MVTARIVERKDNDGKLYYVRQTYSEGFYDGHCHYPSRWYDTSGTEAPTIDECKRKFEALTYERVVE